MIEFFKKFAQATRGFFQPNKKKSRKGQAKIVKRLYPKEETPSDSDQDLKLSKADLGAVLLRSLKMLSDFFYIIVLLFCVLGAGLGVGYFASQIDSVKVPAKSVLLNQVSSVNQVSKLTYANDEEISDIDTDLLRSPVDSNAISDNAKHAIIATEDENFKSHHGVVPKAVFRALVSSVLGVGSTSGGSTLTQQLIKQQVIGDDPTFKRKAREIIYSLALE
ncbi:transglycosylase domain-containing protein, partial [Streptococcus sobrinus]